MVPIEDIIELYSDSSLFFLKVYSNWIIFPVRVVSIYFAETRSFNSVRIWVNNFPSFRYNCLLNFSGSYLSLTISTYAFILLEELTDVSTHSISPILRMLLLPYLKKMYFGEKINFFWSDLFVPFTDSVLFDNSVL